MTLPFSIPELLRQYKKRRRVAAALRELNGRNLTEPSPGKPHGLPKPLIVSLTSFPARYPTLPLVLKSLLSQTMRPDNVLLWVSNEDYTLLTDEILHFANKGLEIAKCEDLKSYDKIIHTLRLGSDCFIATADDDVYYWPTWLEELVLGHVPEASNVVCHRAHEIIIEKDGKPGPYSSWKKNIRQTPPSRFVFPTGVLGILYPPGTFHPDVCSKTLFTRLCPTADDIWLYWMFRLNGKTATKTGAARHIIEWPGSQIVHLQQQNIAGNGNEIQLRNMVEHYGFPE